MLCCRRLSPLRFCAARPRPFSKPDSVLSGERMRKKKRARLRERLAFVELPRRLDGFGYER